MPRGNERLQAVVGQALPSNVLLFEQQDDFFWLEGKNLSRFESWIGRSYDCRRLGLPRPEALGYFEALTRKGIPVAIKQDRQVRMLKRRRPSERVPPYQPFSVLPEAILDRCDLESMSVRYRGDLPSASAWPEFGTGLYIFKLAESMYEVDWRLTSISEPTFRALALAAFLAGESLPCRLVAPRASWHRKPEKRQVAVEEPVPYGQLSLAL